MSRIGKTVNFETSQGECWGIVSEDTPEGFDLVLMDEESKDMLTDLYKDWSAVILRPNGWVGIEIDDLDDYYPGEYSAEYPASVET